MASTLIVMEKRNRRQIGNDEVGTMNGKAEYRIQHKAEYGSQESESRMNLLRTTVTDSLFFRLLTPAF
jgi:hypothetical protein